MELHATLREIFGFCVKPGELYSFDLLCFFIC